MSVRVLTGDCRAVLKTLPEESVQMVCTSPPYYGLRSYLDGNDPNKPLEIGSEPTPDAYVAQMVEVFRGVRRVLRDDGLLWLNLGDTTRNKQLLGIPWRVAFALQADGWWLRSAIVWHKPNPMPESIRDRPTSSYEMVFLLAKSAKYFWDAEAIAEPFSDDRLGNPGQYKRTSQASKGANRDRQDTGFLNNGAGWNADGVITTRNARNVWTIATAPYPESHFATMPPELAERCIKAGSKPGDTVLDCFMGAGTTILASARLGRNSIGIELNPSYCDLARNRVTADCPLFAEVAD